MERPESPQNRARVIIVSQRKGGSAARSVSSTTLSLMPRWTTDRAVEMAARTFKDTSREARGTAR